MKKLPDWYLLSQNPAYHDMDSKTVLEQTARIYTAMQELICEHNAFTEEIKKAFTEFTSKNIQADDCYKAQMNKLMLDYIRTFDEKVYRNAEIANVNAEIANVNARMDTFLEGMYEFTLSFAEIDKTFNGVHDKIDTHDYQIRTLETGQNSIREQMSGKADNVVMESVRGMVDYAYDAVYDLDNRVTRLENNASTGGSGGGDATVAGGKMYIHSLKNDKMTFNFYCSQSTPFTLDTLKPYVKGLLSSLNCQSYDGIPGYGYIINSSNAQVMTSAISALSLTQYAPICLMGADSTNHQLTNVATIEEFVDTVVEI